MNPLVLEKELDREEGLAAFVKVAFVLFVCDCVSHYVAALYPKRIAANLICLTIHHP